MWENGSILIVELSSVISLVSPNVFGFCIFPLFSPNELIF